MLLIVIFQGCTCVFIVSTYTDGQPPKDAVWFCKWLEESSTDFRVQKSLLGAVKYAVFGLGNSQYKDNFNVVCYHYFTLYCRWGVAQDVDPGRGASLRIKRENIIFYWVSSSRPKFIPDFWAPPVPLPWMF